MKSLSQFLITIFMPAILSAQTVDVKDVSAGGDENTTIEIRKGKQAEMKNKTVWETSNEKADVEGEEATSSKEAKANYKKACVDWKKELKDDNKENVSAINCGKMTCTNDVGRHTCRSEGTYKIRTKVVE